MESGFVLNVAKKQDSTMHWKEESMNTTAGNASENLTSDERWDNEFAHPEEISLLTKVGLAMLMLVLLILFNPLVWIAVILWRALW